MTLRLARALLSALSAVAVLAAAAALAGASPRPAAAALPSAAVLIPGTSLAGIALGMPAARVTALLGRDHGTCARCTATTWYFQTRPFSPQALGVELEGGRVSAVFTLWSPPGFLTRDGLGMGTDVARLTAAYPTAVVQDCEEAFGYDVMQVKGPRTTTGFVLVAGKLFGFILQRPAAPPCR